MLVSVFASWCVPCRIEHPVVSRLAEQGVVVQGINYKDKPQDAKAWLAELGDPFAHIGADRNGRVGIDWGVYGVPETYVIDKDGRVAYRHVGPLQPQRRRTDHPAPARAAQDDPLLALLLRWRAGAGRHLARRDAAGSGAGGAGAHIGQGAALPRLPEPVDRRFGRRPRARSAPSRPRAPHRRRQRRAGADVRHRPLRRFRAAQAAGEGRTPGCSGSAPPLLLLVGGALLLAYFRRRPAPAEPVAELDRRRARATGTPARGRAGAS